MEGQPHGSSSHSYQLYQAEKAKTSGGKSASLQAVCKAISDDYFTRTQIQIHLDHNTLAWLSKGGRSLTETDGMKSWLTNTEQDLVVQFVIELVLWGFPLSPRQLQEHAEHILRARLGDISRGWPGEELGNMSHHETL